MNTEEIAIEKLPTPYCIFEIKDQFCLPIYLSEEAQDLFGYDFEMFKDLYLFNPSSVIFESDRNLVHDLIVYSRTHIGTTIDLKTHIVKSNGITLTVDMWGKTIAKDQDVLWQYIFFKERKHENIANPESKYEYSLPLYDTLMESSKIGIIEFDLETDPYEIIWINEAAQKMLFYTRSEFEERFHLNIKEFFKGNEEEYEKSIKIISEALKRKVPHFELNTKLIIKGQELYTQGTATPIENHTQEVTHRYMYYSFMDITESVLQKRNLAEARLKAEQANESKSSFLSSMSHDMRTPLNGIVGFTDFALKEDNPEKKQMYLEKIKYSANLLSDLVSDTLDLSRIESGKMMIDKEKIDARLLFKDIVDAFQTSAEPKNIKISTYIDLKEDEIFYTDRQKLQKIVINLLSNAIKYTPPGGQVTFRVEKIDPPLNNCTRRISVEDTGIGIGKDFLSRIFEPFAQERRQEARDISGTGLGLAIVHKIVTLLGGTISVESTVGQGSCFTVDLPIEVIKDETAHSTTEEHFESLHGHHVLLVEDNDINREICTLLLKEVGITTDEAANGEEGVTIFLASPSHFYDAILMDMRMPLLDGQEATQRIRRSDHPEAKSIPIIAVTADVIEANMKTALKYEMNDYLSKPIDATKLYRTLQKHIK